MLAVFFGFFAYAQTLAVIRELKLSSLLLLAKELLDVGFYLSKRRAWRISHSLWGWLLAFAGTTWPLLYRPTESFDIPWDDLVQISGAVLQIFAILSLNRSFGIVPANRGVKTGGMYRLVRHPLYLGYVVHQVGYVLNNLSSYNVFVFVGATLFQVLRIYREEEFLSSDPAYRDYMTRTRWRLIPGLF